MKGVPALLRWLDLVALLAALPVFVVADLPMLGYVTGAGAWLAQRAIQIATARRAADAEDPRTVVGLAVGSMIGRGWLVAGAIFLVGVADEDESGLAAAVLVIALFTIYLSVQMAMRPFEGQRGVSR